VVSLKKISIENPKLVMFTVCKLIYREKQFPVKFQEGTHDWSTHV
jgi:hypothetical protein